MRVMIVEDEPLIALAMQMMIEDEGWLVAGPFAAVKPAMDAVAAGETIDCALLDCNLGGETSWQLADALIARKTPFAFTSGQGREDIDPRFGDVKTFPKPVDERRVKQFLLQIAEQTARA